MALKVFESQTDLVLGPNHGYIVMARSNLAASNFVSEKLMKRKVESRAQFMLLSSRG